VRNKILIYGITGQDGSYLAKCYLDNNFIVHGISRKKRGWNTNLKKIRIENKLKVFKINQNYQVLHKILKNNYKYIVFLGGQSSVINSFYELEEETFESQIIPLQIILENLKKQKRNKTKFMFGSSSEIFGYQKKIKLNDESEKKPQSPYALSKLIGYEIVKSYREMFNLKTFSIIFFNHESILRNKNFIFKKISNYIKNKRFSKKIEVGNVNVIRDWGSSEEYMELIYKILNDKNINDYVLATGKSIKLKKVIEYFFMKKNLNYQNYIKVNKKYFRKYDINENYADISKIKKKLNLFPKKNIKDLVDQFLNYDNQ